MWVAHYKRRIVGELAETALKTFGAVVLEGPRAVGKTTTGLEIANSSIRLDASPNYPVLAETSPSAVLSGAAPRLIDEWQLAPTIWNSVRHEVDSRREPGQFILAGSASPSAEITRHSGAGRFKRLTMRPMSLFESGESSGEVKLSDIMARKPISAFGGITVPDYAELIVRGGWPALVGGSGRDASDYLTAYLSDISLIDIREANVSADPQRVRELIRALARNVATEIPATKLAKEAELNDGNTLSAQSARRYLDALTRVYVLEEQPAWAPHLRSKARLRTSPKWHFIDPSLAAAALGANPQTLLGNLESFGLFFESLCIRDLRVYASAFGGEVYHYRDENGLEVDAIVESPTGSWAAFEVKMGGSKEIEKAAAQLKLLSEKVSDARKTRLTSLNVLTAGEASYTRPDGVNVIALGHLRD